LKAIMPYGTVAVALAPSAHPVKGVMCMRLQPAILLLGIFLATSPSFAADGGFYAGAGIGQMNVEVDDMYGSSFDFDEDDLGFKLFGGYKFFPWFSVEGIFLDGGSPETKDTSGSESASLSVEVQSLVAAAVFSLPIGDQFEIFLKPGFAYWDSTTDFRYSSPTFSDRFSDDDSGSAFFIGAGAGWTIGNAGLRLEYEWVDVAPEYNFDTDEFEDELDASAGFLSLSVAYFF
jgi:OOP family OmpA-OmpF porin